MREEHHSDEEVAVEEAAGEAAAAVVAVDPQLLLITKVREATRYLLDRSRWRVVAVEATEAARWERGALPGKKANQGSLAALEKAFPVRRIYGTFFFSQFSLALFSVLEALQGLRAFDLQGLQ